MQRAAIALALPFVLGCRTQTAIRQFDADYYWRDGNDRSALVAGSSQQQLSAALKDTTVGHNFRSPAVGQMFATYVRPVSRLGRWPPLYPIRVG